MNLPKTDNTKNPPRSEGYYDAALENHYLPNLGIAMVTVQDSRNLVKDAQEAEDLTLGTKTYEIIPWGEDNNFPAQLTDKVYANPVLSSNMLFNVLVTHQLGIKPMFRIPQEDGSFKDVELDVAKIYLRKLIDNTANEENKKHYEEMLKQVESSEEEIQRFIDNNDLDHYLLEALTDMHWFYNVYPVIQFNQEKGNNRKLMGIYCREASFSRLQKTDKNGRINNHFYNKDWTGEDEAPDKNNTIITPVLDPQRALYNLQDEATDTSKTEYVLPVNFPTPGRNYYQKPYYYAIFESGWYDFAQSIPEVKKALIKNNMRINYVVKLSHDYFTDIFNRENIRDEKEQKKRINQEYADIEEFLSGAENVNKSIITFQKHDPRGNAYPKIEIVVIDNKVQGNEYIEDSEEVSNIMSYGMLVHPSMVGSAPGKNKNINGTEARELFIIKQAQLKPIVGRVLHPLDIIKKYNQWPRFMHWVIPSIALTTLDKNKTGQTQTTES